MKTFHLVRDEDETGISGTGVVAEGVIFRNNWVAVHWLTQYTCVNIYSSIAEVEAVHGHQGKTRIVFDSESETEV